MRRPAQFLAGYVAACVLAAVAAPPGTARLAVGLVGMAMAVLIVFRPRKSRRAMRQSGTTSSPLEPQVAAVIESIETVEGVTTESALHAIAEHYLDGQDSGGVRLYAAASSDGLQIDLLDRAGGVKVIKLAVVE